MKTIIDYLAQFSGEHTWVLHVFIIVLLTLLANFVAKRLLSRLHKQLEKTSTLWDDALIEAARKPLAALIWVIGIGWAAEVLQSLSDAVIFAAIDPVRDVFVIILLSWFLVRFISEAEKNILAKEPDVNDEAPIDASTVHALGKLVRLSIIITAALVMLQTLGYSVSGVLAFGGIGGIAVGFAAKDLLANFFGGLMIYLDRPFSIGDWVRSPDQEIEGVVEYVGWRQTRIRTFDKRPLYIPNSTFMTISVENPSRMSHRRIYETIGLRYDDAAVLELVVKDVESMLKQHPEIDTKQTLMVNVNAFGESSLDFFVYCFTKTVNWQHFHVVKQDVLVKILNIIAEHGADVAYPTQVISLQQAGIEADS